jgi:2'-5' RNA ligase
MRVFIAVRLPAAVRRSIAAIGTELECGGIAAKWVPPANIHLTLKFLGEQGRERLAGIRSALVEIASETSPIELQLRNIGAFPSPRRPRAIWVGVESGPRIRLLHAAIERRMTEFGVGREERPFRPHVTVGRVNRRTAPGDLSTFERQARQLRFQADVEVEAVDLMESRLRPEGAEYRTLYAAPLTGS